MTFIHFWNAINQVPNIDDTSHKQLDRFLGVCCMLSSSPSRISFHHFGTYIVKSLPMKQLILLAAFLFALAGWSQTNEIDSLVLNLAFQKQDSTKVDTSVYLIKALYEANEPKKALQFIDETERLAKALNYAKGQAEVAYYRALIYSERNDYFNAIDSYNKSKQFYQKINDTLGVAKVNNNMGILEIKRGNYIVGLELSLSAIKVFEEKNMLKDLAAAYNNLAEAYVNTKQYSNALEFNLKALDVKTVLRDSMGIINSNKNIAMLYGMRNEYRKSIEHYEAVLQLLDKMKAQDKNLRGEILPLIGNQYLQFKEYDKAEVYLYEALKYNKSVGNQAGTFQTLNAIGDLNLSQNKTKIAESQIIEAHELSKQSTDKKEILKNFRLMVRLDSIRKRYESAFKWQQEYYKLKEELYQQEQPTIPTDTRNTLSKTTTNLDGDSTSGTPTPQNDATKGKSEQVERLKLISYILIVAFITALSFLLLIYVKRKNTLKYTQELEEKNRQIQKQNAAIQEQTQHLEEINKSKDRLFSIVSHDLKDSISSIKGFLDLLKEDSITKEEFTSLIPELSDNANNASLLLYNLLNWSKSQMQNLEPSPELFNIQDVFKNKISLVEPKIEQKRIVLIDESQSGTVYADKNMIEIVVQNLITNAVKFSRVGDIITISNKEQNGKTLLSVEDTGVGIPKEHIEKLFKGSGYTTIGTKNEKGTGLGLSICKELVELNQGRIWVESTPNIGSKFFVELPKSKV